MKRVLGLALLLLAAAMIGYGAHTVISNGNCSSTGYVSYGPVPKCGHGSEFLGITSLFFVGPVVLLVGWALLRVGGVTWPLVLAGVGVGSLTIHSDKTVAAGARSFGLVFALVCLGLLVVSLLFTTRRLVRRKRSPARPTPAAAAPAPPPPRAPVARATPTSGSDAISKIERLAQLRDSGALTPEEFEQQKAKVLAQI